MSAYPSTSREAYKSLKPSSIATKHQLILSALEELGEATTEEVADYLRVPHETIWKRFSELARDKKIHRPGTQRQMKSGRNGMTWKLTNPTKKEAKVVPIEPPITNEEAQQFWDDYLSGKLDQPVNHNPIQQSLF